MTNIDLTPILQALLALIAALITYRVVPWIKARTTEMQRENLEAVIRIAVFAAEQLFGSGYGAEKLDYATQWLKDRGYTVDRTQIEAVVYDYLHDSPHGKPPDEGDDPDGDDPDSNEPID